MPVRCAAISSSASRTLRPALLVPDFDLIAIRVVDIRVREPGGELAAAEEPAAGALDFLHGGVDVLGADEPEPEVLDASGGAGGFGLALEGKDVVAARSLDLDAVAVAVVLLDAEDFPVEAQRAFGVADGETDVRQSMRFDHPSSRA